MSRDQNAGQNHNIRQIINPLKGRTVQIFGNNPKNQNPFRKKLRAD
jgi:calcineurin-like phosphoesterase family protein